MIPKAISHFKNLLARLALSATAAVCLLLYSGFSWASAGGSVGFDAVNYFYQPTPDHQPLFQSVQVEGKVKTQGPVFEGAASGQAMVLVTPQAQPFFEIPEAYGGTSHEASERAQIQFGRKLESWNQLDDQWRLGLFQPRFRWDYFHPDPVGLTGAFATLNLPKFRLLGFTSPIFIPERGVPIAVNNGSFESPTPWFIAPGSKIVLFDRPTQIRYNLDIPPLRDIVFNPSLGLLGRYGDTEGLWVSAGYTYKPMNQLFLGHDAYLELVEVSATIRPRVVYHHLAEIETGFRSRPMGLTLSTIYEKPVSDPTPANWTVQTARPAFLAGSSFYFLTGAEDHPTRVDIGFLRRFGGNAPDAGRDANGTTSVFEPRYPFASAMRVGVASPLSPIFGRAAVNMNLSSRLIYDTIEDGALWQSEFNYTPRRQWRFKFGADLLATEVFADNKPSDESFISRYKMNNRVHAGVSYVF